jgi:hemerythrin-like domain-containing protein
MDVLTQLSADHERLSAHLARIQTAAEAGDDGALTAAIEAARPALTTELDAHIALEEGEAFPIFAQAHGEELMTVFFQEHVEIRALREEALACAVRRSSCLRLCELILDHLQREDMMLFPRARREDVLTLRRG